MGCHWRWLVMLVAWSVCPLVWGSNRDTPEVRAIAATMPSVVNLSTEKEVVRHVGGARFTNPFFHPFSRPVRERMVSLGSGCVIDPSGLVITNSHVVSRATRIQVTMSDGRTFLAREIASCDTVDVALLKIIDLPEGESLPAIKMAKVGDLMLGETVIAVGNPYGLGDSVSRGILSSIGRQATLGGQVVMSNILQTDAAINPGNSGGPLVNLDGEMIGIAVATHRDAQGISFAIPLETVENSIGKWLVPERFADVALGIFPAVRQAENGQYAYFLDDISRDSPAWEAGLRPGMQIVHYQGKPVDNLATMSRDLWRKQVGEGVEITCDDGQTYRVAVREIPLLDGQAIARLRLGLGVRELTRNLAKTMGYPFGRGVVVSEVLSGNPDIRRGDILAAIGDTPIYSLTDIAKAMRDCRPGDEVNASIVTVTRDGNDIILIRRLAAIKLI